MLSFEDFYNSVWLKVPSVWRDADDDNGKALQLLVYTMAQHMYHYFYSKVVYMDQLFDPDLCPAPYLKFLASMIGWTLIGNDEASWREQIKAAPLLYKVKGTKRGIALAERLVGYSIFISDLYRDHLGEIVPKEAIWNNTPDSVVDKPWFRTQSRDDSGNIIPGEIVSDLFDSYNEGDAFLGNDGKVIRPFVDTLSNELLVRSLSTTPEYDNLTGTGSLARYAKTPRINVVLKKLTPLDAPDSTGNTGSPNIDEALSLLLQFKPFHVFINNIQVMVDLSDYVLGDDSNPAGGDGTNTGDALNCHESMDFTVYIDTDNDPSETISYRSPSSTTAPTVWSASPNRSTISAKFRKYSLAGAPATSDFQTLSKLGISTKQFITVAGQNYGYFVYNGRVLTTADFLMAEEDKLYSSSDKTIADYVDSETRSLKYNSLRKHPTFSFRTVDISNIFVGTAFYHFKSAFLSTHNLFDQAVPTITNCSITAPGQTDSVTVSYSNTTELQSNLHAGTNSWNIKNIQSFQNTSGLTVGTVSTPVIVSSLQEVFANSLMLVLSYNGTSIQIPSMNYTLTNRQIILDTVGIANIFLANGITLINDSFIDSSTLYILYLEQSKESDDFPTESTSRSMYLHSRTNKQFSRQFDVPSTTVVTNDNITAATNYTFDDVAGTLEVDVTTSRVYRTDLPIFNRGTLRRQVADGGSTPVIVKNPLNVCDYNQWQVYSNLFTIYYAGSEKISNVWWTDFYQAPAGDSSTNYLIPYSSVDISAEAQVENRTSLRWKAALNGIDTTDPNDFLVTRRYDINRNNIWTRGSALKLALPYKGGSRSSYQYKRGETVLFNRVDSLSDYATQTTCPSNVSHFKYTLDNTPYDVTNSYFNPVFDATQVTIPTVENFSADKVKIHPTIPNYIITTPDTTSIYDGSLTFTNRLPYYSNKATGALYASPYACNMVVRNYPQLDGLIYDSLDSLDIMVEGLQTHVDKFLVASSNGITQTSFILPYTDLFVCWYEVNTGVFVNSGNFSNSDTAIPNIRVFINGIQSLYNGSWTMSLDILKAIIVESAVQDDIITVEYQTLSNNMYPVAPAGDEEPGTSSMVITKALLAPTQKLGTLFTMPLPTSISVSWADSVTGEYLSTSTNAQTLMPVVNYETAFPNVQVLWNGSAIKYGYSWKFVSSVINNVTTSYIQLQPNISYKLSTNDTLELRYQTPKVSN